MKRLKNQLIAAAVLIGFAAIGTFMSAHRAGAQGPPAGLAVNLVSPLPVPVTGSLTLPGTVSANITNPATAPVLALNIADPGRIPYQSRVQGSCGLTVSECLIAFPPVPVGQRLVIQHVSIIAQLAAPTLLTPVVTLSTNVIGTAWAIFAGTGVNIGSGQQRYVVDQAVQFYVEAGQTPYVNVALEPDLAIAANSMIAHASVFGYLLDCTIAQCAPIAH